MIDAELETLVHLASRFVADRFRKTGEVEPMFHAVAVDGAHMMIPAPVRDKNASFILMRALFAIRGVVRYVFFDQGWMVHAPASRVTESEVREMEFEGVEHHPDRREVVFFTGEAKTGACVFAHRFILRPEHGRSSLSPLVIMDTTESDNKGRLIGLLT